MYYRFLGGAVRPLRLLRTKAMTGNKQSVSSA